MFIGAGFGVPGLTERKLHCLSSLQQEPGNESFSPSSLALTVLLHVPFFCWRAFLGASEYVHPVQQLQAVYTVLFQ